MNICVVGQGRLGLALSLHLESLGFNILGIEKDPDRIKDLNLKSPKTFEPDVKSMLLNSKRYKVISDLDLESDLVSDLDLESDFVSDIDLESDFVSDIDLILICINTSDLMSDQSGSFLGSDLTKLFQQLNETVLMEFPIPIVLISTVPVGYCNWSTNQMPWLRKTLIYHPLFIAQGSIISDLRGPGLALIGYSDPKLPKSVCNLFEMMYNGDVPRKIMRYKEAELTKLAINSYLCTKITFANMIGDLCESLRASSSKVLEAVGSDKRIGGEYLMHGLPIGGACLPTDLNCLIRTAGSSGRYQAAAQFLGSIQRSDRNHLDHCVDQYLKMNLDVYAFTDIGYKPGVPLLDNSPKLNIACELLKYGRKVIIKDSQYVIEQIREMKNFNFPHLIFKPINK